MEEATDQWTWNDGWILMAVYLARSSVDRSLADVIGTADALNHAIPTPNELSNAFTKLVNAGLLEIDNKRYTIRNEYLDEIDAACKARGGLFESPNKEKKWLKNSVLVVMRSPRLTVTQEDVDAAYKRYTSGIGEKHLTTRLC